MFKPPSFYLPSPGYNSIGSYSWISELSGFLNEKVLSRWNFLAKGYRCKEVGLVEHREEFAVIALLRQVRLSHLECLEKKFQHHLLSPDYLCRRL